MLEVIEERAKFSEDKFKGDIFGKCFLLMLYLVTTLLFKLEFYLLTKVQMLLLLL